MVNFLVISKKTLTKIYTLNVHIAKLFFINLSLNTENKSFKLLSTTKWNYKSNWTYYLINCWEKMFIFGVQKFP